MSAAQGAIMMPKRGRAFVTCRWNGSKVDCDLQCVAVNAEGSIFDCLYYNKTEVAGKWMGHSKDQRGNGYESVGVDFDKIHSESLNCKLILFVVAAFEGSLQDADGVIIVHEERKEAEPLRKVDMEKSAANVDVVAAMVQTERGWWEMNIISRPAQKGQHFMDILPTLQSVIREYIPHAPRQHQLQINMGKDNVLDLPVEQAVIEVGLGWDSTAEACDLDLAAVLLDANGECLEGVFHGEPKSKKTPGIEHSGDNQDGEGRGDDEKITVNLSQINEMVKRVVFVVNVYEGDKKFGDLPNSYCKVTSADRRTEYCKYSLQDVREHTGLVVGALARKEGGRWGFQALGYPFNGRKYQDGLGTIKSHQDDMRASWLINRARITPEVGAAGGQPSVCRRLCRCFCPAPRPPMALLDGQS